MVRGLESLSFQLQESMDQKPEKKNAKKKKKKKWTQFLNILPLELPPSEKCDVFPPPIRRVYFPIRECCTKITCSNPPKCFYGKFERMKEKKRALDEHFFFFFPLCAKLEFRFVQELDTNSVYSEDLSCLFCSFRFFFSLLFFFFFLRSKKHYGNCHASAQKKNLKTIKPKSSTPCNENFYLPWCSTQILFFMLKRENKYLHTFCSWPTVRQNNTQLTQPRATTCAQQQNTHPTF